MNKVPTCWGAPGDETLTALTEVEAIENIMDEIQDCLGEDEVFPATIIVCGYARMDVEITLNPLEHVLEELDEEYGDPEGTYTEPTLAMKEAEEKFLAVIKQEYTPWMCEEVCRREISVVDWLEGSSNVQ